MYEIKENKLVLLKDEYSVSELKKIVKLCDKNNLQLVLNSKNEDLGMVKQALTYKDKEQRYNYIYDAICKKLDDRIINENYCEFENDVCIRFRKENPDHKNGCCEWSGRGKCKYLKDSVCTMKTCMACKLFTCKFLEKEKGIKQSINDFLVAKVFFNKNQRYILECSFWTPKPIVMKRLLANNFKINE
ncbi:MAG: hypothetical protein IJH20_00540 [Bacilli bacterium]|nr:hypothetical protein [Bacilli bacterium]